MKLFLMVAFILQFCFVLDKRKDVLKLPIDYPITITRKPIKRQF